MVVLVIFSALATIRGEDMTIRQAPRVPRDMQHSYKGPFGAKRIKASGGIITSVAQIKISEMCGLTACALLAGLQVGFNGLDAGTATHFCIWRWIWEREDGMSASTSRQIAIAPGSRAIRKLTSD